jgi:hypothetical protein
MEYSFTRDPAVLDRRRRLFTEFRMAMRDIAEWYPRTSAGTRAMQELTVHVPERMGRPEAEARMRVARDFVKRSDSPIHVYEGWLQLREIRDGYLETDELLIEAILLDRATWPAQDALLVKGEELYTAARSRLTAALERANRKGASAAEQEAARKELERIASEAGAGSYLAGQARQIGVSP